MNRILFAFFLFPVLSPEAQKISFSGDNYITFDGGRFHDTKIMFTKVSGDWFSTDKDAHASLTLNGTYDNRPLTLDIEWDGKSQTHGITNEIRHASNHAGEFIIMLPDKNVYGDGLNAYPSSDEVVKISVPKISDQELFATITGEISNNREILKINGTITLKKSAPVKTSAVSSFPSYKDCDNVIHDKLVGAEDRSPTECEILLDKKIRKTLHDAFSPAIKKLPDDWEPAEGENESKELVGVARNIQRSNMYEMGFTTSGGFKIQMKLKDNSPAAQKLLEEYERAQKNLSTDPNKGLDKKEMSAFESAVSKVQMESVIHISADVNYTYAEISNFLHHEIWPSQNGVYIINAYGRRSEYGGEAPASETFIYLGKWGPMKVSSNSEGEVINLNPLPVKGMPALSVQRILIKIKAGRELTRELVKNINFSPLLELLNYNR